MSTEYERYLATRFPRHANSINFLCETDRHFDSICYRYREICNRLLHLEHAHTPYVEAELRMLREEQGQVEAELLGALHKAA